MMKQLLLLLALLCTVLHTRAQHVTNVTAEQQGQDLLILYHLEADGPVEVQLYLSTDRGRRWEGPLKSCAGDVGPNVAPGTGKRIRWEVLKDRELVGNGIAFKVVARRGMRKEWLNPSLTYGSVTDIDGNTYATIKIGKQIWMAENLRTTRYQNGNPIPHVTDGDQWSVQRSGAWCHYANNSGYDATYGKLYNWYTVADPRRVCPAGWHLPTDAEWTVLSDYLGGKDVAAGKLKSTGTYYWQAPNTGATNNSGFSGLPGGCRYGNGYFYGIGNRGLWWSAPEIGADYVWYRALVYGNPGIYRNNGSFGLDGFCVRCVRD